MKNIILTIFIFAASISAQDKNFQIEVGMNNAFFKYEAKRFSNLETDFTPAITGGIYYKIAGSESNSLFAGVKYFSFERKVNEQFEYIIPDIFFSRYNLTFKYISFPFQLKNRLWNSSVSSIINIQPSYLIKSELITDASGYWIVERRIESDQTGNMNRIQIFIGAGVEIDLNIFDQEFGVKTLFNYNPFNVPQREDLEDYKIMEAELTFTYSF